MGHKKRAPKLEAPSPTTKTLAVASKVAAAVVPAANIKTECERALTALRRGNHQKALRLMKEVTPKFENSALFHRVAGTIYVKVAAIIDDPNVKSRHLKNAVESARKAKELSPNSVEYAHFYANLLLEVSNESKEYEEVISECERALAVENPNDPALDELSGVEKDETVSLSEEAKEARVSQVKSEIRGVIQRANIASISSWMKNLGGGIGEEKFRIIPVGRRAAEDPVEVKYLSGNGNGVGGRRGNEIKKAVKTVEERRKEIEVRVAAARLLQQKNETVGEESKVSNVSVSGSGGGGGSSGGGGGFRGGGEKRRSGGSRRIGSISERKDQVRSFWNTMSFEMKRDLLSISVSDLRAHLDRLSSKDGGQAGKAFSEAVAFGDANQTWKFWACCCCGERFADASAHIQHVIQEHTGNLLPKLRDVLPVSVDNEWEEMLISCSWEPLDLTASVRMLEDECKVEASEFLGRETLKVQADDCWNDNACSEDTWESLHDNKNEENSCNSNILENGGANGISNIECKTCDKKVDCKMYNQNNSWPLSDDTERAKLLKKISSSFQALLRQKCLTVTHLQKVIHYTMEELEGLFPGSQILSSGVDQTPLCICFLEASPLKKIADFLQNISYFGRYPERVSADYTGPHPQILDCEDRITLDESASSLQLDESLLPLNGVKDDVGSGNSVDGFGKISQPDSDPLLSWIYAGSSGTEQLATWSRIREERCQEGMQLLETLGKEFNQLRTLCEKKHELLGYEEALQGLEKLLIEESNKKEQVTDISYRSYESILQKRRDELVEVDNEALFVSNRLELDIITTVMKEAETLHVSQYGYEDTYGGVASHHCDLESGDEEWRSKDYIQRMDNCTKVILQRQKEHVDTELSKLDAQIMCKLVNMNQLEVKLETVSVLDYRFILLPLMKSFMRVHLEDLAEKDATEKSDAAREAFLAELALDSKKCSGSGNDNGKTHEKMKDRKRNKELRRIKDSKLGGYNDQLETADQLSLVGSDILESESSDTIKELDDEFQRKLEIEAEERKLEETLEYQRRLENEAKQRLLAEQRRRTDLMAFDDALDHSGDVQLGISEAPHCKQVAFPCKSDGADSVNSSQRNLRDDTNLRIADDVGIANSHLNPALSNVGNPSDGALPFEHQAGRRGKRRNSMKVPEGKYQTVSHGKENAKLENSTTDNVVQKEQAWNLNSALNQTVVDGGSKTLRQLQAEEDEEERFQADLKKAVMQSLDTFQARQKIPVALKSRNGYNRPEDFENFGTKVDGVTCDNGNEVDLVGRGLQNEIGEYNCFLNVIIQSLWHLRRFREEFLRRSTSEHVHVGDPCVVCALFDILTALSVSSGDANAKPVTPSMLRIALSNLYPENNFFQEGQMNDASEVLGVIFECLHRSFTAVPGGTDSDSVESNGRGSWDCSSLDCVAHTLFGMDIFERMNCYNCGLESRHLKYTSFFHNINASALRTMKVMYAESSFVELLNSVEMNHQLACDPEVGGCGKLSHIHHILSNPPHVFTAVLGWQNTCESLDDIKATLEALSTEIDMSVLYRGLDLQILHRLVSVVCYYGQHYHCFAYSHDHEKWIMYDDKTVKVIGSWKDVLSMCERGHLQPQVLFYEAVN